MLIRATIVARQEGEINGRNRGGSPEEGRVLSYPRERRINERATVFALRKESRRKKRNAAIVYPCVGVEGKVDIRGDIKLNRATSRRRS